MGCGDRRFGWQRGAHRPWKARGGPECWPLGLGGHLRPPALPSLTRQRPAPGRAVPQAVTVPVLPPGFPPLPWPGFRATGTLWFCVGLTPGGWVVASVKTQSCHVCDSWERVLHTRTHACQEIGVDCAPSRPAPAGAGPQASRSSERESRLSPGCPSSSQETSGFPPFAHTVLSIPDRPRSRPWSQLWQRVSARSPPRNEHARWGGAGGRGRAGRSPQWGLSSRHSLCRDRDSRRLIKIGHFEAS